MILVFASGGQSQLDMWDPKPQAPVDVRGEFSTIGTRIPGIRFGEHLPKIANIADRFTLIRSMSHEDLDHGSAAYLSLTGRYHSRKSSNPPPRPSDYPTYGAIIQQLTENPRFVYNAVHVNGPLLVPFENSPGQNGGLLGRSVEPLVTGDATSPIPAFSALTPKKELPGLRLERRLKLKQSLDRFTQRLEQHQQVADQANLYGKALEMLQTPACREAFDLSREPAKVRESYGLHRSGQACLVARRLVEAGVPWITVMFNHSIRGQDKYPEETDQYGWDTHNDIFTALKQHLIPRFDQSFPALLLDLESRGLLDETLVVCMGEFGRAPKVALEKNFVGTYPGRKHWASTYSMVVAGAGVQKGNVVGASDRLGAEPISKRFGPWDVAATMFHALGIDPATHYHDPLGRPFAISTGKPIRELY